jgi:ABC-type lipoprotein export system ATPase subunit/GNAT superfamily N-acetyltransferase
MDIVLEIPIQHDFYTEQTSKYFDVPFSEKSKVVIKNNINFPDNWKIGLLLGPSGCGKSTLLKSFGDFDVPKWNNNKAIISNFEPLEFHKASNILCSVGLSTIPTWFRPYNCLSNGEQFRANLARILISDKKLCLIDEFTSVVHRDVAKATSYAVSKWIQNQNDKKVIFSSCHSDIIEWLNPDWVYNPLEGITTYPRGLLRRPKIDLKIFRSKFEAWELFKQHHYLSANLNKAAKCFLVTWNDQPVAFNATLALPHPVLKNSWRASRTVVLPDFQGLGIGSWLSDYIGSMVKAREGRFFSKTTHPAMINYRLKSKKWKETTHSRKARPQNYEGMLAKNWTVTDRVCYAFEYIGASSSNEEAELFWNKC